jgi:hypothetical protein
MWYILAAVGGGILGFLICIKLVAGPDHDNVKRNDLLMADYLKLRKAYKRLHWKNKELTRTLEEERKKGQHGPSG